MKKNKSFENTENMKTVTKEREIQQRFKRKSKIDVKTRTTMVKESFNMKKCLFFSRWIWS